MYYSYIQHLITTTTTTTIPAQLQAGTSHSKAFKKHPTDSKKQYLTEYTSNNITAGSG